jgi:hypothetical protein
MTGSLEREWSRSRRVEAPPASAALPRSFYTWNLVAPRRRRPLTRSPSPRVRGERVARQRQERGSCPARIACSRHRLRRVSNETGRKKTWRRAREFGNGMRSRGRRLRRGSSQGGSRGRPMKGPSPGAHAPPSPRARGARGNRVRHRLLLEIGSEEPIKSAQVRRIPKN